MRSLSALLVVLSLALLAAPTGGAHGGAYSDVRGLCGAHAWGASAGCVANVRYTWTHPVCAVVDGSHECAVDYTATGVLVGDACVHFGFATSGSETARSTARLACAAMPDALATPVRVDATLTFVGVPLDGGPISWSPSLCLFPAADRTGIDPRESWLSCSISSGASHAEQVPPA